MRLLLAAGMGLLCCSAWAETAYTVRATELKAKPFSDAATTANLSESSKVDVLTRQASWTQVKAEKATGWVKMLNLRLDDPAAEKKSGASGVSALFSVAATGSSGSATTTGVKGVTEEDLKNPHPDPAALKVMQNYAVSAADAQKFARAGKLVMQKLDYVENPGAGTNH